MKSNKQAFTLIELLVVVLIIGILAAVALPQYQRAVEKSHIVQAITSLKALVDAQEVYYLANGSYTSNLQNLDITVNSAGYYTFTCYQGWPSCIAHPIKTGYPAFEFVFKNVSESFSADAGKQWCQYVDVKITQTDSDKQHIKALCQTLGILDTKHTDYYILNK